MERDEYTHERYDDHRSFDRRHRRSRRSGEDDRSRRRSRDRSRHRYEESRERKFRRDKQSLSPYSSRRSFRNETGENFPENKSIKYFENSDPPTNVLMLSGLHPQTVEENIKYHKIFYGYLVEDVRIIRNRLTGETRGFGFVTFTTYDEATRFINDHKGIIEIDEKTVHLEFSKGFKKRDEDWICIRCSTTNFKRREFCFRCSAAKEDVMMDSSLNTNDGENDIGKEDNDILLIRGLKKSTSAQDIGIVGLRFGIPIKDIRVIKEKTTHVSRCFAFVFFFSLEHAQQFLYETSGKISLERAQCQVTYARKTLFIPELLTGAAAAAAEMCAAVTKTYSNNLHYYDDTLYADSIALFLQENQQNKLALNYTPNIQIDPSTGYSYETKTGYYYDTNSHYFYDSINQTYLYYDAKSFTYVAVPSTSQSSEVVSPLESEAPINNDQTEKNLPQEIVSESVNEVKPSASQKIVDDLKRWEKKQLKLKKKLEREKLKSKTEHSEFGVQNNETSQSTTFSVGEESVHSKVNSVLRKERSDVDASIISMLKNEMPDEELRKEIIQQLHLKYLNFDLLQCSLCQKKLKTAELLRKHSTLSQLHLGNLEPKILEFYSELQVSKPQEGYRDRAAERRLTFGVPSAQTHRKTFTNTVLTPTINETSVSLLNDTNIGNQILKSMGWVEGKGLGKHSQGIVTPIEATANSVPGVGIGADAGYNISATDTYQERIRKISKSRFDALQ